jgi:hypothetical protein
MAAPCPCCACGLALHYVDATIRAYVQHAVETKGPTVPMSASGKTWLVPRHYLALHGPDALADVAARYRFQRIK